MRESKTIRCEWVTNDDNYIKYHDEEWGKPIHDSIKLFEMLCLEGQQAGLSWKTVLHKRENYRKAFKHFNPNDVIKLKPDKEFIAAAGIIRHEGKVNSIINNSKAYIALKNDGLDFRDYIWSFVDGKTIVNTWKSSKEIPTSTDISHRMAIDLKKRNFSFVGPTI